MVECSAVARTTWVRFPLTVLIKKGKKMFEKVKGFSDFLEEEALKREAIKKIIIKNFKLYGFEPAETPLIEYESFVKGDNQQDEAISDIFKLRNSYRSFIDKNIIIK